MRLGLLVFSAKKVRLLATLFLISVVLVCGKPLQAEVQYLPFTMANGPLIWNDFESQYELESKGILPEVSAFAEGQQRAEFSVDVPGPYSIAKVLQPHAEGPTVISEINGQALRLSALGSSYIRFADTQDSNPDRFVAEFFIKLGVGEQGLTRLLQRGTSSQGWSITYAGGGDLAVRFDLADGDGLADATLMTNDLSLNDGQWHHVALAYDGGIAAGINDITLYVDYYLKAQAELPGQGFLVNNGDLMLGHIDENSLSSSILIDDFRFMTHSSGWNRDQFLFTTREDGLPLIHTNRDATEAFYLSFDPQLTIDHHPYEVDAFYDIDGDPSSFNQEEQTRIAAWGVFSRWNWAFFDLNITTDYAEYTPGEPLCRWKEAAYGGNWPVAPLSNTIDHEAGHQWMGNGHAAYDVMGNFHLRGQNTHHRAFTDYDGLGGPVMHFEGQVGGMPKGMDKWFNVNGTDLMGRYTRSLIDRALNRDPAIETDGYQQDDYIYDPDNMQGTAYAVGQHEEGTWIIQGNIDRMSDVDGFSFQWTGGKIKFDLKFKNGGPSNPRHWLQSSSPLDAAIAVYDENGTLVAYQDPDTAAIKEAEGKIAELNDFAFVGDLAAGKYYVEIESAGNYADLGHYIVTMNASTASVTSPLINYTVPTVDSFTSYYWTHTFEHPVMRLVWQDAYGESGYIIDRWDNDTYNWNQIAVTGANESWLPDTTVDLTTPGEYRYRVTPVYEDENSNQQFGDPLEYARFAPIAGFTTVDRDDQLHLSWQDTVGETEYRILRRTDNEKKGATGPDSLYEVIATLPADTTSFHDESAETGNIYIYRLVPVGDYSETSAAESTFIFNPGPESIQGVSVWSNKLSNYTRPPQKMIDGSGLGGDLLHDDGPYNFWEVMWPNSIPSVYFDLGGSFQVDTIHVWNRSSELHLNRMARDVRLSYSTEDDPDSYTVIDDYIFPKPIEALDPGFTISLAEYDLPQIRRIRFEVTSNYLGTLMDLLELDHANARVGIAEVRFYSGSSVDDLSGSYAFKVPLDRPFSGRTISASGNPDAGIGFGDTYNTLAGGGIDSTRIWTLTAVPGEPDTYTIQSQRHGLYMDGDDSDEFEAGYDDRYEDTIVSRSPQNDDSQKWIVKKLANGHFTIQEQSNRYFLSSDFYIQKTVEGDSGNVEWAAIPIPDVVD